MKLARLRNLSRRIRNLVRMRPSSDKLLPDKDTENATRRDLPLRPLRLLRLRGVLKFVLLLVLTFVGMGAGPVPAARAYAPIPFLVPSRYFPQTGHNVGGNFLAFFEEKGGEQIFGLPITEPFEDGGVVQQCFEHACLKISPHPTERVEIADLGTQLTRDYSGNPAFAPHPPAPRAISTYFPATEHNLSYQFRPFWEKHGGHPTFGFPISEAFIEQDETGAARTVQYFERARLEYRLARPGTTASVQVGTLGRDYVRSIDLPASLKMSVRPITVLGSASMHFGSSSGYMRNIRLAARQFDGLRVMPGDEVSFLNIVGELSTETGYVEGAGIVNGSIGQVIAGGICHLSTALFRAVFEAGLEVLERHPHSLALADFNTPPGLDSAVYTPSGRGYRSSGDVDLRWRNDTTDPVLITTEIISNSILTVSLWGYENERTVHINKPIIRSSPVPAPVWRHDARLPPCTVRLVARSMPSMNVTIERIVKAADETVIHEDRLFSSYGGLRGIYLYGDGVIPIPGNEGDLATVASDICQTTRQHQGASPPETIPAQE